MFVFGLEVVTKTKIHSQTSKSIIWGLFKSFHKVSILYSHFWAKVKYPPSTHQNWGFRSTQIPLEERKEDWCCHQHALWCCFISSRSNSICIHEMGMMRIRRVLTIATFFRRWTSQTVVNKLANTYHSPWKSIRFPHGWLKTFNSPIIVPLWLGGS